MGVFTNKLEREVRLEYMRPTQIDEAKKIRSALYVPFGSIEWHGRQNAVGLDAIKAHEELVGLALRCGGVVHPAVFFGAGGGHSEYPHSFMVDKDLMQQLLLSLLHRWEKDGYEAVILLSGHYPNKSEFLQVAADEFKKNGGKMRVLPIIEKEIDGILGDHAAREETSFQLYLHPETVDMSIYDNEKFTDEDYEYEEERHNWMENTPEDHPCFGILGRDPRKSTAERGKIYTNKLLNYLENWLKEKK
jgi:creatinine amidohydrolase